MISFHGEKSIKDKYLKRVKAHEAADEIIKGKYWEGGKGCAVGCTIHSSDHSKYEIELGIPKWLARLEDRLFEGVSNKYAKTFPKRFLSSIKVGIDLDKIKGPFLCFVLRSCLTKFDHSKFPEVKKSIDDVIKAWETGASLEEFRNLRNAAAYAAYATTAYAAYAAAAAADAAAAAAAAAAADAAAAKTSEYEKFADELLRLLKECK